LQRAVGLEPFNRLGGGLLEEQWNDFHQTPDSDHQDDQDDHQEVAGFDPGMPGDFFIAGHVVLLLRRGQG